jgi:hypothetical protein
VGIGTTLQETSGLRGESTPISPAYGRLHGGARACIESLPFGVKVNSRGRDVSDS